MVKPVLFHLELFERAAARLFERTRKRKITVELRDQTVLFLRKIQLLCDLFKQSALFLRHRARSPEGHFEVAAENILHAIVGVGVVIDVRVMLVGARDLQDFVSAARLFYPAAPIPQALFHDLQAALKQKGFVARPIVIMKDAEGNVGIDMRLHKRVPRILPNAFVSRYGRTKSVFRALTPFFFRVFPRRLQHAVTVFQKPFRRFGRGRQKERKLMNFAIPPNKLIVALARKSFRGNAVHAVLAARRNRRVIACKTQIRVRLPIAPDCNVHRREVLCVSLFVRCFLRRVTALVRAFRFRQKFSERLFGIARSHEIRKLFQHVTFRPFARASDPRYAVVLER